MHTSNQTNSHTSSFHIIDKNGKVGGTYCGFPDGPKLIFLEVVLFCQHRKTQLCKHNKCYTT